MIDEQITNKMKYNIKMREFSYWTEESYLLETKVEFYGKNKELDNPAIYNELINKMCNKEWIGIVKSHFKMQIV